MQLHIPQNLLNLLLIQISLTNKIGSHQFLLAYQPVIWIVNHLECFQVDSFTPVSDDLGSNQLQKLTEIYESVAVLVDLVDNHFEFFLLEGLSECFEDLIELLCYWKCILWWRWNLSHLGRRSWKLPVPIFLLFWWDTCAWNVWCHTFLKFQNLNDSQLIMVNNMMLNTILKLIFKIYFQALWRKSKTRSIKNKINKLSK